MYSKYDVFKYKALTAPKFYWVVGHGTTLRGFTEVPPNTWVIFLSKPGHALLDTPFLSPMFRNQIIKDTEITRSIALDNVPRENLPGIRLHSSSWNDYIYGPGDRLPTTYVTFQPSVGQNNLNQVLGVHDTSKPNVNARHRGINTSVNQVIAQRPGIYFIAVCRPTQEQRINKREFWLRLRWNKARGGTQNNNLMVTDPSGIIHIIKQNNIARIQSQQLCRLNNSGYRRECGIVNNNGSVQVSQPTKKRRLNPPGNAPDPRWPFINGMFTFAPGVPNSLLPRPRKPRPRKPLPRPRPRNNGKNSIKPNEAK
jgi:hypothetical protein